MCAGKRLIKNTIKTTGPFNTGIFEIFGLILRNEFASVFLEACGIGICCLVGLNCNLHYCFLLHGMTDSYLPEQCFYYSLESYLR